jgi:quercetin dioxygenase-like cupin family protein
MAWRDTCDTLDLSKRDSKLDRNTGLNDGERQRSARCKAGGRRSMGMIHRFRGQKNGWAWEGVAVGNYGAARPGVTVQRFISRKDSSNNMEIRYFEIEAKACSNFEKHNYEHAVLVLRGSGTVQLGEAVHEIGMGDAVFVESDEVHRFVAGPDEPLGFLCAVLDKELRFTVHGEQQLVMFDDETGQVRSREHYASYAEQAK